MRWLLTKYPSSFLYPTSKPGRMDSGWSSRSYVVMGRLSKISLIRYCPSILSLRFCSRQALDVQA